MPSRSSASGRSFGAPSLSANSIWIGSPVNEHDRRSSGWARRSLQEHVLASDGKQNLPPLDRIARSFKIVTCEILLVTSNSFSTRFWVTAQVPSQEGNTRFPVASQLASTPRLTL